MRTHWCMSRIYNVMLRASALVGMLLHLSASRESNWSGFRRRRMAHTASDRHWNHTGLSVWQWNNGGMQSLRFVSTTSEIKRMRILCCARLPFPLCAKCGAPHQDQEVGHSASSICDFVTFPVKAMDTHSEKELCKKYCKTRSKDDTYCRKQFCIHYMSMVLYSYPTLTVLLSAQLVHEYTYSTVTVVLNKPLRELLWHTSYMYIDPTCCSSSNEI